MLVWILKTINMHKVSSLVLKIWGCTKMYFCIYYFIYGTTLKDKLHTSIIVYFVVTLHQPMQDYDIKLNIGSR